MKTTQSAKVDMRLVGAVGMAGIVGATGAMAAALVAMPGERALAADGAQAPAEAASAATRQVVPAVTSVQRVDGQFAYAQGAVDDNATIASRLGGASATLCDGTTTQDNLLRENPLEWQIAIGGDVRSPCVVNVGEAARSASVKATMMCSCGGNPAGGLASVNAEAKGIPVTYLLGCADPAEGVNTVTFVAADGTTLALPLGYVVGRHAQITYDVNGEDLSASTGGSNQLWIQSAPGNAFLRDVVQISVTKEANPPAAPQAPAGANLPNASVTAASVG